MKKLTIILISIFVLSCSPKDKPLPNSKNQTPAIASVQNNGSGYYVYLLGRLQQAKTIIESAIQPELTFENSKLLKGNSCKPKLNRMFKKSYSDNIERVSFYVDYDRCKASDDQIDMQLNGEEKFQAEFSTRTDVANQTTERILDLLNYSSDGSKIEIKPKTDATSVLSNFAKLQENIILELYWLGFETQLKSEDKVLNNVDVYSLSFKSLPETKVFQDLRDGDYTAYENSTELFKISGEILIQNGQVVGFQNGKLYVSTEGSRSIRSNCNCNNFTKFNNSEILIETSSKSILFFNPNSCSSFEGTLNPLVFRVPKEMNTPQLIKGVKKQLQVKGQTIFEPHTGHTSSWESCNLDSFGKLVPYSRIFLK